MEHVADVDEFAEHLNTGFNVLEAAEVHDHVVAGLRVLSSQHRPDLVEQLQDRST